MDRHWNFSTIYVLRCQFRHYSREIQLFENARARLRWAAYSCAICDFCLHINPNLMMTWSLKQFYIFVCTLFFPVWPREQFYAGTSNFACLAQIRAYMNLQLAKYHISLFDGAAHGTEVKYSIFSGMKDSLQFQVIWKFTSAVALERLADNTAT